MLGSEDFIALNEIFYPTIMQVKMIPDQNFHGNVFANTIINLQKSVKKNFTIIQLVLALYFVNQEKLLQITVMICDFKYKRNRFQLILKHLV